MTAKRFRVNELIKYNYSDIGEYIDENHTDKPLRNDEVAELLNELHEENQSLKFQLDECQNHKLFSRRELEEENGQLKKDCTALIYHNQEYRKENEQLKQYKQSVSDILRSWSQKNLTAKQLQVVIAIMEELNILGDVE